jgi:cytochrome c biogenesis protein
MATAETDAKPGPRAEAAPKSAVKVRPKKIESGLDKVLGLLSSVKLGVTLLMILLTCCVLGMVIMQQDVDGFQTYYAKLLPAQKLVYGGLGFFGIYSSWYFDLLLAITGLNIILASIDRFPTAWQYVIKPKRKASPNFIKAQMFSSEVKLDEAPHALADKFKSVWRKRGLRGVTVSEDNGRITVFGQRNVWNRLGAYVIHVFLLTIFTGGFLTSKYGVGGMMDITPGMSSDTFRTMKVDVDGPHMGAARLPFAIQCTDIQQKLVHPEGGLDQNNTVDWLSYIRIADKSRNVEKDALVHLNEPYDYRGYRFFQSRFEQLGNARSIVISLIPTSGGQPQDVTIERNKATEVPGIGKISYSAFFPDFTVEDDKPATASPDYNSPVVQLRVVSSDGVSRGAFALSGTVMQLVRDKGIEDELVTTLSGLKIPDQFYDTQDGKKNPLMVAGKSVILKDFEKVGTAHVLAVQYDPGRTPVYIGFLGIVLALCSVFFFAHQRMWAVIEPDGHKSKVYIGGNTNRNRGAFEPQFSSFVELATGRRGQTNE